MRSAPKGNYVDTVDFNASLCNNKLVGANVFITVLENSLTPRDKLG
jgi:hypothetical protein